MQNLFERVRLTEKQKIIFTVVIIFAVIASGFIFQYSYHIRKERYTHEITGFYRKYFHREPDTTGLKHWVTWALNKWDIKKVEQKGFAEVAAKGGPS